MYKGNRTDPAPDFVTPANVRGLDRRKAFVFRASSPSPDRGDTPVSSTLPLPPRGKGAGGAGARPTSLDPLRTSGNQMDLSGANFRDYSPEWNLWAADQAEHHEYREIFCSCCGELKSVPITCKNRFCPVCSRSRRMKVQERMKWLIDHTPRSHTDRLKMLTLTQQNSTDLSAGVDRIVNAFKRLRQEKFWKVASPSGCWVVEVTGDPGRWHIHIHALLVSKYLAQAQISAAWKRLTGAPVIHITAIEPSKGIGYVTKYVSKGQFDPAHVDAVAHALRSVRLFNVFGGWHNMKAPKVKLVCKCPHCNGTRWQPLYSIFPCTDSQARAWMAQLRDTWDSQIHSE